MLLLEVGKRSCGRSVLTAANSGGNDARQSDHSARDYWARDGFLDPPILQRTERLTGIPGTLLHVRRDVIGPLVTAWRLNNNCAESELIIGENEGHGGSLLVESMCAANSRHATRILGQDATFH